MTSRSRWVLGLAVVACVVLLVAMGIEVRHCRCGKWVVNWLEIWPPHDCAYLEAEAHLRIVYAAQQNFRQETGCYATTQEELVSQKFLDDSPFDTGLAQITLRPTSHGWRATAHGLPGGRVLYIDEAGDIHEQGGP